jgi:hypothetical protein
MTIRYVDPAATGDNNGTSWTHAWPSLQTAADTAVAGYIVYCRGNQPLSATIVYDTQEGSNASGFIKFIGCNSGGTVDGTKFVLDGDSTATNCILLAAKNYIWWENFEFKNATGAGWDATSAYFTNSVFINCISHNNGGDGWDMYYSDVGKIIFLRCYAYSNGGDGFGQGYRGLLVFILCISKNNTSGGFDTTVSHADLVSIFYGCVAHNNGLDGIKGNHIIAFNSIADENDDDGINIAVGIGILIGNRITDNGKDTSGYGLNAVTRTLYGWNFLLDNDSGATTGLIEAIRDGADADTNETSGTEGYNDGDNDDFNLTDSATLRRIKIELPA